jgi:hypothetical protein
MLTRISIILINLLTGYCSMPKPVGGRGKKAPYETTHLRVPEPLVSQVKQLIERFYGGEESSTENPVTSLDEAIVLAQSILLQKKSARQSMQKLLTALYRTEVKL